MTNVPNEIRQMWTDVYVLFDLHFKMPNTAEAWKEYWEQAEKIRQKHGGDEFLVKLIGVVTEMLEYYVPKKPCTLEDMNLF